MKVYVLVYLNRQYDSRERFECLCKHKWEMELYATREAAEAAAVGQMFPTIWEKEMAGV